MCGRTPDLIGQRFGKLLVLKRAESKNGRARWFCKCDCGNTTVVSTRELRTHATNSCGCLRAEVARRNSMKHGKSHTRLYKIWCGMRTRCTLKGCKDYHNYGERGIKVCKEWDENFENFYDWSMSNGYKDGLSIDRIDVNSDYKPSNCRWATQEQQGNNTRANVYITYNGKTQTLKMWSKELKLGYWMLLSRYEDNPGINPDELFRPKTEYVEVSYQGRVQSIVQWCKELGYSTSTIYGRYYRDKEISPEELLRPPRSYPKSTRQKKD